MTTDEAKDILLSLLSMSSETECLEFKKAENNIHFDDIGEYFSAISNEANLKQKDFGWLILGVDDKHNMVGTNYRKEGQSLNNLKFEIAQHTTMRVTIEEIYELDMSGKRVIMLSIPAAPEGIPIAWKGHWYGRDHESLVPLNIGELEQIRRQAKKDWSAQICPDATIDALDKEAIQKARNQFKIKNPNLAEEVNKWNDGVFLNKAKVTIDGKITRTAIVLLGKPESTHYFSPAQAQITWILKDERNIEKDYEHFYPPFILNTDVALWKIRNLKYRYLPDGTLFPMEVLQYDSYVIREALHNCIAHQDYERNSRIIMVEMPDELIFVNAGSFLPGSVEAVIEQDAPQKYYRNHFLTQAMVSLNMIDTIGGGIKKMFITQKDRYFPLPTYILENPNEVKVKIAGRVIDERFTKLLIRKPDLELNDVMILDKIQKGIKVDRKEYLKLKKQGLSEGRYPNVRVVSKVASLMGEKATYIKNRAFDDEHYKKMILSFIQEYGSATRKEINELLLDKLSDVLTVEQKMDKIGNLLYVMSKKEQCLKNIGTTRIPKWVINKDNF